MQERNKNTIGMFLDIEHLYGQHEGTLAPIMWVIGLTSAPILLYIYFGLYWYVPIPVLVIIDVIILIRSVMIFPGRERARKKEFKAALNSSYTTTKDLINFKMIHPDGCIEYSNGRICYILVAFNGTTPDEIRHSVDVTRFMRAALTDLSYDIQIYNITDMEELSNYYDKIVNFESSKAAAPFVKIIDYSQKLVSAKSLVQATCFVVYGSRDNWLQVANQLDMALKSKSSHCYREVTRLRDEATINAIINRDADAQIDLHKLQLEKYATGNYGSSKVIAYDIDEDESVIYNTTDAKVEFKKVNTTGFMQRKDTK